MPTLTPQMTAGKIARWHVAEGQDVAAGDVLVEVATSTATLEIEAENEGRIERILVPAGTEGVKVDTPIAILFGEASGAGVHRATLAQPVAFAALESARSEPSRTAARRPTPSAASLVDGFGQSYREALRDALASEMRRDPDVFVIGVDVAQNRGAPRVTQGLLDEFGAQRVVSVAAVDEALFGLAVGAAFAGLKPVVELSHWGRALEALGPALASAAETFALSGGRLAVPIVFRGPNGFVPGLTGQDARCVASHVSQIPGLAVVQPATASTARAALQAAIRHPGPVALLEHDLLYPVRESIALDAVKGVGEARIARAGRDLTIAAAGHAVGLAMEAAQTLARDGIEAEVVDLMWLNPLDRETVAASVRRTGRLVTVEEGWERGGLGAELVASVTASAFAALKAAPVRIAGASVPMPYAAELQAAALPAATAIVSAVRALLQPA